MPGTPFAIINTQPELAGPGCPCFGVPTALTLGLIGPGGFQIVNIDGSSGGSGQTILANWILNGCDFQTTAPTWAVQRHGRQVQLLRDQKRHGRTAGKQHALPRLRQN
jgi:hypothetical protein